MNTGLSFLTAAVLAVFGSTSASTSTPTQTPPAVPCAAITRTLAQGSRGPEVMALQRVLAVEQTAYFGPLTRQKLVQWQISKKIIDSATAAGAGTTGPKTRAALKCPTSTTSTVAPAAASSPVTSKALATTTAASSSSPVPAVVPAPASGGSMSVPSVSPYGYTCVAPGSKPAASSCADGTWQLSADEAGCIIWGCLSEDDRG